MSQTVGIYDQHNQVHQVTIDLTAMNRAKQEGYKHLPAMYNATVPTRPDQPSAAQQIYAQMGAGLRDVRLSHIINGAGFNAGAVTEDGSIAGRLVVLPYLMDTIENKLRANDYGIQGLFNRKAAVVDTINGTKFDRPILNLSKAEAGRSRAIAQLSEPASMLTLTTSDKSFKIAGSSIGMEISDEAAAATSLNLVSLSMTRQAEVENLERVEQQLLAFLNGDTDLDMSALSAVTGAVKNAKADFDSSITAAGELTQQAWMAWLFSGNRVRSVDTVITDFKGAMSIQNRKNRPTVQNDNGTSPRIDTKEGILNPAWSDTVDIIVSQDPNWPANTLVGFDSRYGYHIVNSVSLQYSAMEEFAIRKSSKIRVDSGSISYRLFDDAWQVLTLTV